MVDLDPELFRGRITVEGRLGSRVLPGTHHCRKSIRVQGHSEDSSLSKADWSPRIFKGLIRGINRELNRGLNRTLNRELIRGFIKGLNRGLNRGLIRGLITVERSYSSSGQWSSPGSGGGEGEQCPVPFHSQPNLSLLPSFPSSSSLHLLH